MYLLVGGVILLVVSNVLGQGGGNGRGNAGNSGGNGRNGGRNRGNGGHGGLNGGGYGRGNAGGNGMSLPGQLPHDYKDVFLAGLSGKPTLGTAKATCWARGGICVDIRQCPSLSMDVGVAGCSWGNKVCCKVHTLGSPTVGILRRYSVPVINNLDELGTSLETIALRNSMMLSNWQNKKPKNEDAMHLRIDDED